MTSTEMRERLAFRSRQLRMRLREWQRTAQRPFDMVWAVRAELAVAIAGVAGWAGVTLAIARIGAAPIIWPLSVGLGLLSLCGWRLLRTIVTDGLYALTRAATESRRG